MAHSLLRSLLVAIDKNFCLVSLHLSCILGYVAEERDVMFYKVTITFIHHIRQQIFHGDINWGVSPVSSTWAILASPAWHITLATIVVSVISTIVIEVATTVVMVSIAIVELTSIIVAITVVEITTTMLVKSGPRGSHTPPTGPVRPAQYSLLMSFSYCTVSADITLSFADIILLLYNLLYGFSRMLTSSVINRADIILLLTVRPDIQPVHVVTNCTTNHVSKEIATKSKVAKTSPNIHITHLPKFEGEVTIATKGFLIAPKACGAPLSIRPLDVCVKCAEVSHSYVDCILVTMGTNYPV
eukprot:Gb_24517 [translate_table: standard]